MKTLDEVLKSYELSCGKKDCSQCPYDDECLDHFVCECYERMNDTFHYLKEYRDYRNADKTETENGNITDAENDPPLTMKEFSRMIDTEPIWCQELQEWYLFLAYDDGDNRIQLMTDKGDIETFDEDDLEKYPLYRRK